MRARVWLLLVLTALVACRRGTSSSAPDASLACSSKDDCPTAWVCLAGRCADPSTAAWVEHPSNAVTPQKVKEDVEQKLQEEQAREKELEDRVK
jgi:hypothetical protein